MLKGVPPVISPELMKVIMEMGHGDEIVIADGNFPAASLARRLVRADGHGVPELLEAIMQFFPLDRFVEHPAVLMAVVPGDPTKPAIWDTYLRIIRVREPGFAGFEFVQRVAFYERSRQAYAVLATGESELYANVIIKKGVVTG